MLQNPYNRIARFNDGAQFYRRVNRCDLQFPSK